MTGDGEDNSLSEDDDLWGQLLGRKLDRMPEEERSLDSLISKFCDNKQDLVRYHHGSVANLKKDIQETSTQQAKEILYFLWADFGWRKQSTGTEFSVQDSLSTELNRLEEEGNIIHRLNDQFALVWSPEEHRRSLKESDKIKSEVQTEATPVYIRRKQDEGTIEVRGPNRLLERFSEQFSESEDVEEVEPEPTDEPILEELATVFETEMASLTLIEAKFDSTNLPEGSSVVLSNQEGIKKDLNSSSFEADIIDTDNLSNLDYLQFEHDKTGVKIKVSVESEDDGFYFEMDDSSLPEDEKKNVREVLENRIGISFNSLYPFDAQHHREYIINQILTGNADIYRKYYHVLDNEAQDFIDQFVNAVGQDTLYCYDCHRGFYEFMNEGIEKCPDCDTTLMRGEPSLSIEIRENEIQTEVAKALKDFNPDIRGPDNTRLLQLDFEATEIASNTYIKSTFHLAESAGSAMDTHWYEYFTYCLGNGDIPKRVGQYLLDCILITYGNSQIRGRENFGTIGLYQLLRGDNPETEFVRAVRQSQSRLRNRVRDQANKARDRLEELQQKVEDGTIEQATFDTRNDLKTEYDFDDFERDVFYLFKSMFLFTERWGREGKKETDGCLIIPDDDGYFVASYDPKLTYDNKGYDLGADEKNKAAYYILSESDDDYVSDVLKDGDSIDAHIFVSDIFREGQFEHMADTVNDWFSLTQSNSENLDVPIVFLSLESLLKLYRIFDSNYSFIMEYSRVQKAFRKEIQNQFSVTEEYGVIDEKSVERVEEKLLEARNSARRKKAAKGYSES